MKKNIWLSIVSFLIASSLVVGLYYLNRYFSTEMNTTEVLIPNQFIPEYTMVTNENINTLFKLKTVPKMALTDDMIQQPDQVLGKETVVPLGSQDFLYQWQLSNQGIYPKGSEINIAIPKEYLKSVPGTLRRGDYATLIISPEVKPGEMVAVGGEPVVLKNILVSYVKQTSNREVLDEINSPEKTIVQYLSDEEAVQHYRLNANGAVGNVEIIIDQQKWLEIEQLCNRGYKIQIAYQQQFKRATH